MSGIPDFRTDPNLCMGDNYLEAAYEMEKDLEKIRQSEKEWEDEEEAVKNRTDDEGDGKIIGGMEIQKFNQKVKYVFIERKGNFKIALASHFFNNIKKKITLDSQFLDLD